MPLMPSMKLYTLVIPTQNIRPNMMIHQLSQFRMPQHWNISPIAMNCTTNLTLSGRECISSTKLIPATNVMPNRNGQY